MSDVVLTHDHPDHVGALSTVTARAPSATIWGGRGDAFAAPTQPVGDGDAIRGLRVVATPGQTPGHLCLLLEEDGILFSGDAIGSQAGQLTEGPATFIADPEEAFRSVQRLAAQRVDRVVFGHGDEVMNPADALARFVYLKGARP